MKALLLQAVEPESYLKKFDTRHVLLALYKRVNSHGLKLSKKSEKTLRKISPQHHKLPLRYNWFNTEHQGLSFPKQDQVMSLLDELEHLCSSVGRPNSKELRGWSLTDKPPPEAGSDLPED